MNRAERRRAQKENAKLEEQEMKKELAIARKYKIGLEEVKELKQEVTEIAIKKAFKLMLSIPTMVIHDKFGLLMKKEVDGKSREERFADLCIDLYDSFDKGYVTMQDLDNCMWEEAGFKIE